MWWMINYDLTIHLNQEKWIKDKHVEKETAFFWFGMIKACESGDAWCGFLFSRTLEVCCHQTIGGGKIIAGESVFVVLLYRAPMPRGLRAPLSHIHDTSMQRGRNPIQIFTHTRGQRRILEIMLDVWVKPERTDWEDSEKKDGELERGAGQRPLRRWMDVGREDVRTRGVRVGDGWFAEGKGKAGEADLLPQVLQPSTNDQTVKASQQDGLVRSTENQMPDQETTAGKVGTWTRNIPWGKTIQLEDVTQLKHGREVPRERHALTLLRVGGRAGAGINIQDPPGWIQQWRKLSQFHFRVKRSFTQRRVQTRSETRGNRTKEGEEWRAEELVAWNIPKTSHNPRFEFRLLLVKVPHSWVYQAAPYRSPHPQNKTSFAPTTIKV